MNSKQVNVFILFKRLACLVLVAAGAYWAYSRFDTTNIQGFISLIASTSGTLAGFLFTCMTILIGMDNTLIRNLKRHGHFKKLLSEMFCLIVGLLLLVLLGGIELLLPGQYKPIMDKTLFILFFVSSFQFGVTFRRFYLVIKISAQKNER